MNSIRVAFVGDIMLSGNQKGRDIVISHNIKRIFDFFDARVATLETAIGEYKDIDVVKNKKSEVSVWSDEKDLCKLLKLNVNVVSLANNHSCDCGINVMLRSKLILTNNGITPIGAGTNLTEAMEPAIIRKENESLAIIACCKDCPDALGTLPFASDNEGGLYRLDENIIIPHIKRLKKEYTYVAVVVHWGLEHQWLPEIDDVEIANKIIAAGADAIIGGHPHHIQPIGLVKKVPIYYSLGNFYFPDFCLDKISNTYYPSEEEYSKLPVFDWMAPDVRNFAMLYFWKYYGRLGIVALLDFSKTKIRARKVYSIYNNGLLSKSSVGFIHSLNLSILQIFIGRRISSKINRRVTIIRYLFESKVLSIFNKKYDFFNYVKKHNV